MVSTGGRDDKIDRWRAIRHRRQAVHVPEELDNAVKEYVRYYDKLPEYVVERMAQTMRSNKPQVVVSTRGDIKPEAKRKAENIEDWMRGILDELDPLGIHETRFCKFQAGDGLAVAELEMLPDFVPPYSDDPDGDYDDLVEDARKDWGLPIRLQSPDPRMLYWPEGDRLDRPPLVVKVMNRPLIDVQQNWTPQGFRLALREDGKTVDRQAYILGAPVPPTTSPQEYGRVIRLVRITDGDYIYDCCFPQSAPSGPIDNSVFNDMPGTVPSLMLLARYKNPLGHPPYYFAPARATTDSDPSNRFYPLALEVIESGADVSDTRTMRKIKSWMEVTKPVAYKPDTPPANNDRAGPRKVEKAWSPGILEHRGTFSEIPSPQAEDLDKFDASMTTDRQMFNSSLASAMQAGQLGRQTPAWSIMQVKEEQLAMYGEPQDMRAGMYRSMLQDIEQLMVLKYGKGGKVYVRTSRRSKKAPQSDVEVIQGLAAEDFKVPHNIGVTIDTLTQSQRAALTEYGRRLLEEDTISHQTYEEEYVGLSDPVQEQARKDREKLIAKYKAVAEAMGDQMAADALYKVYGPRMLPFLKAGGLPDPSEVQAQQAAAQAQVPTTPMSNELASGPSVPGQGMSQTLPEPAHSAQMVGNANGAGVGMAG